MKRLENNERVLHTPVLAVSRKYEGIKAGIVFEACDQQVRSKVHTPVHLTGTLKLMDSSEQLLWSVQVDHQLFALQKLDVTVSVDYFSI